MKLGVNFKLRDNELVIWTIFPYKDGEPGQHMDFSALKEKKNRRTLFECEALLRKLFKKYTFNDFNGLLQHLKENDWEIITQHFDDLIENIVVIDIDEYDDFPQFYHSVEEYIENNVNKRIKSFENFNQNKS